MEKSLNLFSFYFSIKLTLFTINIKWYKDKKLKSLPRKAIVLDRQLNVIDKLKRLTSGLKNLY